MFTKINQTWKFSSKVISLVIKVTTGVKFYPVDHIIEGIYKQISNDVYSFGEILLITKQLSNVIRLT